MKLSLFTKEMFGQNEMNIYTNENNDVFMTREQIGQALEYKNPRKAIRDIHLRNKERLDQFSRGAQIETPSGKQEATIYNERGIYEIIRFSKQPKADEFYDWVYDLLSKLRKGKVQITQRPKTQLEVLQGAINQLVEQEQRLTLVESRLEHTAREQERVVEILSLNPTEWRKKTQAIINRIAQSLGGFNAYSDVRNESYKRLEERARCDLSIRLTNKRRKMIEEGVAKSRIDKINKMDVIADDARLTEIYLAIVKEMAVQYGVKAS